MFNSVTWYANKYNKALHAIPPIEHSFYKKIMEAFIAPQKFLRFSTTFPISYNL